MKKILAILLAVVMMLCFAACGSNEEPAAETPKTSTVEQKENQASTVDKNEDGTYVWPADKFPADFPEFDGAALTQITSANQGFSLAFKKCEYDPAAAYVDTLVAAGWGDKDESLYNNLGFEYYGFKDGKYLKVQYFDSDLYMKERQIRVTQQFKITLSDAEITD